MHVRRSSVLGVALGLGACTQSSSPVDHGESTDSAGAESSSESDGDAVEDTTAAGSSDGDAVDESSEDESSSGGEIDCGPLPAGSPPSVVVQEQTLVPIDALSVAVTLSFDTASQTATGGATLEFAVGPEGGMPIFDLRQTITAVQLDGVDLGADRAPFFQPSDDPDSKMRAVTEVLAPCTQHTLVVDYDVERPDANDAEPPIFDPTGVVWSSRHSDLSPGRYAEQWMPMNLPHDELAIAVDVELVGTAPPHVFAANGDTTAIDDAHWHVEFPADFSSLSPMLVLAPASIAELGSADVALPEGAHVTVDVVRLTSYGELTEDLLAATAEALIAADLELGDYPHGDRFLVYASGLENGMEYEGATSTSLGAIHHEVFHSWIGRGVRPLMHRDGWLDEAWTTYAVDDGFTAEPLPPDAPAEMLAQDDPWARRTIAPGAYVTGPRLFATVAAEIGADELRGLLRDLYLQHAGGFVTTEELEQFLVCATEGELVHSSFARFVHGQSMPAGPVDRTDCP